MKTLIVYASKYGCTEDCANYLKTKLSGDTEICNIRKVDDINIKKYHAVIIGSSIYAGTIQKEIKKFYEENADLLLTKRVGLFLCCTTPGRVNEYFEVNFPAELLSKAVVKKNFGGEIRTGKMGFFPKLVIKIVSNGEEIKGEIFYRCIDSFAEAMNS